MEEIIKEKISADHLLYVSLKYTKTCDVIMNLILRWRKMIETSVNVILEHALETKKIKAIPASPLGRLDEAKKLLNKDANFQKTLDTFEMFRKVEELKKERIGEFRKNVCLKINYKNEEISVNLEKLKEYAEMLEKFISSTKQFISK